jgi:cell division septation protein DedD
MEKDNSQLELFSQVKGGGSLNGSAPASFLSYIRAYEKTLLVIIGFIITGIVAFSFGVEKGRHAQVPSVIKQPRQPAQSQAAPAARPQPVPVVQLQRQPPAARQAPYPTQAVQPYVTPAARPQAAPAARPQAAPVVRAPAQDSVGGYTIQLASFQSKEYAVQEADALRKRGLSPVLFSQGSYTVLCVGKFNSKDAAQSLFSELKTQYRGCYIRRL